MLPSLGQTSWRAVVPDVVSKKGLERFYAAEQLIMQGKAGYEAMAATLAEDVRLHQSPDLRLGESL